MREPKATNPDFYASEIYIDFLHHQRIIIFILEMKKLILGEVK